MPDFLALFTLAVLFIASLVYVSGCDRLKGSRQ
jgi:hypothetical protein